MPFPNTDISIVLIFNPKLPNVNGHPQYGLHLASFSPLPPPPSPQERGLYGYTSPKILLENIRKLTQHKYFMYYVWYNLLLWRLWNKIQYNFVRFCSSLQEVTLHLYYMHVIGKIITLLFYEPTEPICSLSCWSTGNKGG